MKGKVIVIAGVFMGLFAGLLVLVLMSRPGTSSAAEPTPEPPSVLRAAQNIAKGDEISLDTIQLVRLEPGEPAPPGSLNDPLKVTGMTASMDIPQGMILQKDMFYDKEEMVESGQRASMLFQPGYLAVAFPIGDIAGVGDAVKAGDHVDVIASFEMVNVDSASQIRMPLDGSGEQLPRMVVQTMLQNIEVLRVGAWSATPDPEGAAKQASASSQTEVITLLVTPQDALVLRFLLEKMDEGHARVALALRSEDDNEVMQTEAVTLDYIMKRFNVQIPPKLEVTTEEIAVKGNLEVR